jgi:hypothetical protein
MGTLTILYNRILNVNIIKKWSQTSLLLIKIEDKYFIQRIHDHFLLLLNLRSERLIDEENFERLTSVIKLSFSQLMNTFLE